MSVVEVVYCDTYGLNKESSKMVLDVVVKDDFGRYYNFEMQNGYIGKDELGRFQLYAMRLVERQLQDGKNYGELEKVIQLIIYTGSPVKNYDHDYHIARLYDDQYQIMMEKGLLEFHILQTQRMEADNMELKSEGIREVFWMFADEENHKKKPKTKLGEEVVGLYESYQNSDEFLTYCNIERDRLIIKSRMMQSEKKGKEEEKRKNCLKIAEVKYPDSSLEWLKTCTMEQLDKVFELIFQDISYEEFKIQVLNN
ncbi:Rpn family recombination-promoting nuclease/putative transposase [Candidatus Stoquefichus sp. SB1]|uniref:Rpn family recombination-promoting nuclease/putative transposase n=1 Tax=Candidatus Stoquefichus sp. SB1 TaxID=1658109 RepID=UPI001E35448E|nr:Rpn family recombination-promoting nuclease/putative transposase [Candidatus Stoquefichus sp. SB1]